MKNEDYSQIIIELMIMLGSIDTESEEAKLNEFSMEDNNGNRILY